MGKWFSFFLGTPQRFLSTCAGIALIVAMISPALIHTATANLFEAISPIVGPFLQLVIVLAGFRIVFSGLCGGGKKK